MAGKAKKKGGSIASTIKKLKRRKKKGKIQRLVATRNVKSRLALGWKIANIETLRDKHGKILGVKTNCDDLTLMEKEA